MTEREILKCIDDGANFYVSLFGRAEHMEIVDNGFYSYVKPVGEEYGISFIYNIRIDDLPTEKQAEIIEEMKALNMPIWLSLFASDELFIRTYGEPKRHGQTTFEEHDEIYMAMLPNEKPEYFESKGKVIRVQTKDEFKLWTKITNDNISGGYTDMHPEYHYPLIEKGLMSCYILYRNNMPVSVVATMNNRGIVSLEFVVTIPEMRRQGFAKYICSKVVCDTFNDGAKIVTARAVNALSGKLLEKVGFTAYNYVM